MHLDTGRRIDPYLFVRRSVISLLFGQLVLQCHQILSVITSYQTRGPCGFFSLASSSSCNYIGKFYCLQI